MELVLLVHYRAKPGGREAFVEAVTASGVLDQIRAEEGCQIYDYYYSAQDPQKLLLLERWTSQEAQEVHMTQPHMAKLQEFKERFMESMELERLSYRDS